MKNNEELNELADITEKSISNMFDFIYNQKSEIKKLLETMKEEEIALIKSCNYGDKEKLIAFVEAQSSELNSNLENKILFYVNELEKCFNRYIDIKNGIYCESDSPKKADITKNNGKQFSLAFDC